MVTEASVKVRLCAVDELETGAGRLMRAEGRAIAVFRVGDEVFALDNVCPYWRGPLSEGAVSAARLEVTCPWHRFRFDLRTGRNVLSDLRAGAKVYPVEIDKNGDVLVTIGD